MEALVEALKLAENIFFFFGGGGLNEWHSLYKMKNYIRDASDIFKK